MRPRTTLLQRLVAVLLIVAVGAGCSPAAGPAPQNTSPPGAFIVQSTTAEHAAQAVIQAGGAVTHALDVINAVAASLPPAALARLRSNPQLTVHEDRIVRSAQDTDVEITAVEQDPNTGEVPQFATESTRTFIMQDRLVGQRFTPCTSTGVHPAAWSLPNELRGSGVTVAVIDSGLMPSSTKWSITGQDPQTLWREKNDVCIWYKSFVNDLSAPTRNTSDPHGHGTHVVYAIADSSRGPRIVANQGADDDDDNDISRGVAPEVNLVVARALDADGAGSYSSVIAAIDWVIANRQRYQIRVLNLSIYAPVEGPYWADPLNQAVMRAWQAGIVVVTVAGNSGPGPGTITAPGNVPYVITVGALRSRVYNQQNADDQLADFSARGPTESAFVKPDVVVPASRALAPLPNKSTLGRQLQGARIWNSHKARLYAATPINDHDYYYMSGTSMAAAQVSGIVALMLQNNYTLTNDQVKQRLISTAQPAIDPRTGQPTFSVWEQGAGRVNAEAAIFSTSTEQANTGLDIAADLSGAFYHWGPTVFNELRGEFVIVDPESDIPLEAWSGGRRTSSGSWIWSGGRRTSSGSWIWSGGRRTSSGGWIWSGGRRTSAGSVALQDDAVTENWQHWAGPEAAWLQLNGPDAPQEPGAGVVFEEPIVSNVQHHRVFLPHIMR